MTFASFYEIYVEDKKERIRDNTWGTKNNIARTKILPYFGERKIAEIEPKDVIAWQNHLLAFKRANGKGYSASYLRKIHSQELLCKGWFLPSNTYDCGSFVVN